MRVLLYQQKGYRRQAVALFISQTKQKRLQPLHMPIQAGLPFLSAEHKKIARYSKHSDYKSKTKNLSIFQELVPTHLRNHLEFIIQIYSCVQIHKQQLKA